MNNALNIEQIFKNFCNIKLVYNDKEFSKNKIISLISVEVIEIINKNITKNNYKAYGLKINDIENNKNPFFKLDEVRLFMIMIYQDYIRSHKKLNYCYLINQFSSPVLEIFNIEFLLFKQFCTSLELSNFKEIFLKEKTNQFIKNIKILKLIFSIEKLQNFSNEKIFTFVDFYFLDRFLIILYELGGKELIDDFFNLDEEKIGCFFKIPNICEILREIKKAGSIYLLKEFINLDNKKLEIFQKDFF